MSLTDIWFDGSVKKVRKNLIVLQFNTVHPRDYLPVTLISPDLKSGPWIAGGAVLAWYQDKPVTSDIDVFCKNKHQASQVIKNVMEEYTNNMYSQVIIETENATTIRVQGQKETESWTIQVITCRYFNTLQDVIDNFDITVCQVGTAGDQWVLGSHTAKDIKERKLRFNKYTTDAAKRLVKYWVYGYEPVEGTLDAIKNNPESRWEFAKDEEYANAF